MLLLNLHYLIHILSQFSHKTKATADANKDAEDTATLNELDDEQLGEDEENDNEGNSEDEDEEVDLAVVESDAAIVNEVAAEVANDSDLPTLTRTEVNLSRFAVHKVSVYVLFIVISTADASLSCLLYQLRPHAVQCAACAPLLVAGLRWWQHGIAVERESLSCATRSHHGRVWC